MAYNVRRRRTHTSPNKLRMQSLTKLNTSLIVMENQTIVLRNFNWWVTCHNSHPALPFPLFPWPQGRREKLWLGGLTGPCPLLIPRSLSLFAFPSPPFPSPPVASPPSPTHPFFTVPCPPIALLPFSSPFYGVRG